MTPRDRDEFTRVLGDLAELFGRELKPAAVDLYWDALKDLALSTVQLMAKAHAKTGRFFPKPLELRPVEHRALPVVFTSEAFRDGEKRAARNLDALKREKGTERHRLEVQLRYADRIIAAGDPSSPQYAEALQVAARLRPQLRGY